MSKYLRRLAYFLIPLLAVIPVALILRPAHSQAAALPLILTVDAGVENGSISPEIYGMNFADPALIASLKLPVNRWGGNATSRYNYQTDISNHAMDWYFENVKESDATNLPNDSAANRFIEGNGANTNTILTVPTTGYASNGDADGCGFSIAAYGAQTSNDWQWRPDCGNGIGTNGQNIVGNDSADTSITADPAFVQVWVAYLAGRYGDANNGGVRFYALDNEPDLWYETHRDVHPGGASYDELRDAAYNYGAAIKAADPNAQVLGPVSWGWWGYFYSAQDVAQFPDTVWDNSPATNPDKYAHGNVDFLKWYLQQMAAFEANPAHPYRVLDYLDIHYYPQDGTSLRTAGGAALQALRLRSTRSLWDPTYIEKDVYGNNTWVTNSNPDNPPSVRLIPRMKEIIDQNYPGTKLAITEYNWGGLENINGALAQADILGIFGREGVDLATLWEPPKPTQPGAFAFRMYLNYDGLGSTFGDTSLQATSTYDGKLSIYASKDTDTGALKLVIINKTGVGLASPVNISGFAPTCSRVASVYRYSPANLKAILKTAVKINTKGFTAAFPARSITLVVIPAQEINPCPLLKNGSLDTDANLNLLPDNWTGSGLVYSATRDGQDCVVAVSGCSFRFKGTGVTKRLLQTVLYAEPAPSSYTLSFQANISGAPSTGTSLVYARVYYKDGTSTLYSIPIPYDAPAGWQPYSNNALLAAKPVVKILVFAQYSRAAGNLWLDEMSLTQN